MRRWLTILIVFFSALAQAQVGRGLVVIPDTQLILIGDQINLEVTLKSHAADRISFPEIKDTLNKDIEVVSLGEVDTIFDKENINQRILTQNLKITAWDSGMFSIPSLVGIINGDSAYSQEIPIRVFTMKLDSTNAITDIKGNIVVDLTFWDYVKAYGHYVAIGLAIAGAIFLLWFYFIKGRKKEVPVQEPEKRIPPHVLAFERLKLLEEKQLWQKGKHKEYHVQLSEILREYLENRYQILALEQTTQEILGDLLPLGVDDETRNQLRENLNLMDMVKFAKQVPLPNENEGALKAVRALINRTKQLEPETTESS
jgi:hypothetical protein